MPAKKKKKAEKKITINEKDLMFGFTQIILEILSDPYNDSMI